jgi:TPR repeat protein
MRNFLLISAILHLAILATAQNSINVQLQKAESGDVAAQLQVARRYQSGDGVPKDAKESVKWYRAAAAKGNAEAAYTLGVLAYNGTVLGDSVEGNLVHSFIWFSVAADEQFPDSVEARDRTESELTKFKVLEAHEILAALYLHGKEVPANPDALKREVAWLAENETGEGKVLIAHMYFEGKSVPADPAKAESICRKAAVENARGANFCLAEILDKQGNSQAAFEHVKKDATLGYPNAMLEIAKRYRDGNGTKPDKVLALAWAIRCDAGRIRGGHELNEEISAAASEKERKNALEKAKTLPAPFFSRGLVERPKPSGT